MATLLVAAGACSSDNLPEPNTANEVDTTVVYALNGTEIGTPSAFDVVLGFTARPEMGDPFDFAFDIDSTDLALLFPGALVGIPSTAGMQQSVLAFDDILRAPLDDYVVDTALAIEVGTIFIARSRSSDQLCASYVGAIPRYGKFEVIELDIAARTVTLKHLVNLNCGYRDLTPGIPIQ